MSKLGWVVVLPGNSSPVSNLLFSKISPRDYKNMCSLENHVKSDDLP